MAVISKLLIIIKIVVKINLHYFKTRKSPIQRKSGLVEVSLDEAIGIEIFFYSPSGPKLTAL